MNIFTVTMAPINPPYDDGIKNIVLNVARRVRKHHFFMVSSAYGESFPREGNITYIRSMFQRTGRQRMSLLQKLYVFSNIVLSPRKIDAIQFFVTPQPYFSGTFRKVLAANGKRSIQVLSSVHTMREKNKEDEIPGLFFADRVVVYSEYAQKTLEGYGVKNTVRIYPGIDVERFSGVGTEKSFPRGTFSEDGVNILYAGDYKVLRKSFSFEGLCVTAKRVIERFPRARFIMACRLRSGEDEALKKEFIGMTRGLGITDNFSFLDTVEDMPSLFRKCDLGVMPAVKPMAGVLEIPMVILEMALSGRPVLYGDVPPLDELSDKALGVMVRGGGPEDYAEKIVELLEDKKKAASVGASSRDAVMKFFNMDVVAAEYERLYDGL